MEMALFFEIAHHVLGWCYLKRHHLTNIFIYNFILFGVIEYYPKPQHNIVLWWMLVRTLSTVIRNVYNIYVNMDLKFVYPGFDWFRMTTFYVLYSAEYILSILLVLTVFPYIKRTSIFKITLIDHNNRLHFDYSWFYLFYLVASLPNFVQTFAYLHVKRSE